MPHESFDPAKEQIQAAPSLISETLVTLTAQHFVSILTLIKRMDQARPSCVSAFATAASRSSDRWARASWAP